MIGTFILLAGTFCYTGPREIECAEWFYNCLATRYAAQDWRGIEHEGENCAENIPYELEPVE